jgi:hypothetical protein
MASLLFDNFAFLSLSYDIDRKLRIESLSQIQVYICFFQVSTAETNSLQLCLQPGHVNEIRRMLEKQRQPMSSTLLVVEIADRADQEEHPDR